MNTSTANIVTALNEMAVNLGVISTVQLNGAPESAVVYFSHDGELNLYMTTRKSSRKYANITKNPLVSFVVFSEKPSMTVQIEGVASLVTDPADQARLFEKVVELANQYSPLPPVDQLDESEIAFIKITASWARFGNFEITRTGDVFEEAAR